MIAAETETELVIDSFAGGGGASLGIEAAIGRRVDIAVNHDADAIRMHSANHPETRHVLEDVWHARLRELVGDNHVGLLWASPDCRHFSRAKGSAPVSKRVRSLAWVVVRWASQVRPRIICLENVREFAQWGPVVPRWACSCGWSGTEGQALLQRSRRRCPRCESRKLVQTDELVPDPNRAGMTFRLFCNRLRGLGYEVQWRSLNAADFGAPTVRRRLFLIARCDGKPIRWPEPTHCEPAKVGDAPLFSPIHGKLAPWRSAAECIDWDIECPSIFERPRPLAEKTMARIAAGVIRYVLKANEPFLVPLTHSGTRRSHPSSEPFPTITRANRGELALVCPHVAELAHGGSGSWSDGRVRDMRQPLRTIHASGGNHALVSAFIAKHFGGVVGSPVNQPLPTTLTAGTQNQLAAVHLVRQFGNSVGSEVGDPVGTITAGGNGKTQIAAACLARFNHGEKQWATVTNPLGVVTSQGNKFGLVYAFLSKYFGTAVGADLREPLPTASTRDRFAVVQVRLSDGTSEPAIALNLGELGQYVVSDIGMRMLTPRELARAQGFPDSYQLTGTKTSQVARIGNSVCPVVAEAVVKANWN